MFNEVINKEIERQEEERQIYNDLNDINEFDYIDDIEEELYF